MFYALVALACAVVGIIPLALFRKPIASAIQGVSSFFVLWLFLYLGANSTVWPLFGVPGLYVFILWIIAAAIISFSYETEGIQYLFAWTPVILAAVIYMGAAFFGSEFVNTSDYQTMIGSVETRNWTQDIQPKDPKHMRMSNEDNALYLAQKAIGQDGSIGSQFEVESHEITLQLIKGELWYVAPLEFRGYSTWTSNSVSPGYVMVSAEDPQLQPKLVLVPADQGMRYSPSAYFSYDLERHLRQNGYRNSDIAAFNFEIDENDKAWWVVTISKPTVMWDANKVQGVAIVDPATGDSTFYPLGSVPDWVDRVVPSDYVKDYITWWGGYRHGWWNKHWAKRDMVKPGDMSLIYGENKEPEWVTDITSTNGSDNSLVGMMYTNSRTGKSVYYVVRGGGTNSAVTDAVNNNPQINFRKLHGTDPQLYNVYGTMACVVPLFNDSNAFQGVAIVPINNVQEVATGANQYEALRQYEKFLSNQGGMVSLDKDRTLKAIDGVVDRINSDASSTGNVYYVHVSGIPHLFTGGSTDWPKLPVTEKGDRVRIGYYDSDRDVVPLHDFDNLSLVLSESKDQADVRTNAADKRQGQEDSQDADTVRTELQNMTDEQLRELKSKLPPAKPKQ